MPGSITPLPVLLEEDDRKIYEKLEPPKSIVVRYGFQEMVAELPYDGKEKPGCGTKLVARTDRGIELVEMLTTTCANAGCGKSVSRKEMLEYIENSGGKAYPFTTQGRILRVASIEDIHEQSLLDNRKPEMIKFSKTFIAELDLPIRLVDIELLLGGERIIFHYTADHWVDFRELVRRFASEYQTWIEMHQVNAREEARLVADYERCGQHCCCKQFLKVLKPVSMRSAKVQKATLDPTKISGRCGRLMCCLRYEDQTYETLRKSLPHRQSRVITEDGTGTVIDTQILTQLVMVRLDNQPAPAAYPMENIRVLSKEEDARIREEAEAASAKSLEMRRFRPPSKPDGRPPRKTAASPPVAEAPTPESGVEQVDTSAPTPEVEGKEDKKRHRRRRRKRRK